MRLPFTLSIYISRQFMAAALSMLAALSGLVAMFDFIELLRRSASKADATFALVSQIAALRLPYVMIQILPFAILLGGILAFWRLTRSSELIVARAAGVSAWAFLAMPTLCAMLLGAFAAAALSPLSSAMLARAEVLDNGYLRAGGGPLALTGGQLWLRQSDYDQSAHDHSGPERTDANPAPGSPAPANPARSNEPGVAILHAHGVQLRGRTLTTGAVSVFRIDAADRLLARIEAASATLKQGEWQLDAARVILPDKLPDQPRTLMLPTDLTVARVQDSFASPDTLSLWALPGFISLLERSGFSSLRHRLHFHSLLALPLLGATMALVSAGFSMRPARRGGVAQMIASGVAAGFVLFVISKVAEEFGQSGALPVALAAWAPAAAGMLLAVALLLHMEDG